MIGQANMNETILHMIGRSKMNERLHNMTPSWMWLYVGVSSKKKKEKKIQLIRSFIN